MYKAPGQIIAGCWREHMLVNSSSFTQVNGVLSDDFREANGQIQGMPARPGHTGDTTTYSTAPIDGDSWQHQVQGDQEPARPAGRSGSGPTGSQT